MISNYSASVPPRKIKYYFAVIIVIFSVFSARQAQATHASGADLQYTWISGNTFQVTVSFYRDCAGVAAPTSISLNAKSVNCNKNQNYTLNFVSGSGQEITFPCYSVKTKCTDATSLYTGYQQYKYTNTVTLPSVCTDWVLSFNVCCRNCAITTLSNPCNDNMYVEATLNNVAAPTNSSPQFTNIPVAFLCVNQDFTYNHGVIDPNGDSLAYSFITPKTFTASSTVGTVTFNPGYSASQPLTSSPAVTISSTTGDITMHPTANSEVGVTAILIREFRNGVQIGSVIRDMQFLTKICNPNFLPTASGMNGTSNFNTTVCPGTPLTFTVNSADVNTADTVKITWNNAVTGATFTSTSSTRPVGTFSWTPTLTDARSQPYTFTVTVRDNACPTNGSQTYSFSITVPLISATASSPGFNGYNIACKGAGTGTATVVQGGGTSPYTYSWSPGGQTTQTATGLSANTYTVIVTDANGCTKTSSTTLTQPSTNVSLAVSGSTNVSCNGGNNGTATVGGTGGLAPYTYLWMPGSQTTATATGLSSGVYTAKVIDLNGCTAQQSVVISQPSALAASISSFTNVTCQGNGNGTITANVNGGTSPYSHHWSTGATTATVTGLVPGTYRDTVRDAKGCQQIISQAITQPGSGVSIPTSSIAKVNVSCFGLSNGSANVSPTGGTAPYTVTWSNGDIGNSADSLAAGNYNVHIVDGNGCTFDMPISITQPAALTAGFINYSIVPSGNNIACNGNLTGRVKVLPAGGTGPYTYSWSNGTTIDSIKNVGAGSYNVLITDAHGCTRRDTAILTQPTILRDSLRVRNVGCKGEPSGGVRAVTYGGSAPFSYIWNPNVAVVDTAKNLYAGFYQVTITDHNGCTTTDTVTIQEPDTLVPLILPSTYIGAVNVSCNGDHTGSAVVNVFGGTRPFIYQWSQSSIDSFATNLGAGNISVRVVDANGCSIVRDTTLNEPTPFLYTPVTRDPLCFGDSSGYIALHTQGSTPPYNYSWSNSATTDSIGHITTGTFTVYVRDINNCRDTLGFTLANPDTLTANPSVSNYQGFNTSCNGDSMAFISLHTHGGTAPYTYSWSNSSTSDSISQINSGNYAVTIIDSHGCRKDTTIAISQPPLIAPVITSSIYNGGVNVSCNGFIDGAARATASGGVGPYHYLWSNGDAADSALGLEAGPHTVTVTDSNGCSVTSPFTFTEPTPVSMSLALSNYNGFNVACKGDSNACVTLNVTGGTGPYLYIWDIHDTINTSTYCNLKADTFLIRIIDLNGCQRDTSVILTEPQPFNPNAILSDFSGYQIHCHGDSDGSVNFTPSGGVAPFTFNWSNGDTTEDLVNVVAGNYQVIVTDTNSCSDTLNYNLQQPPVISDNLSMNGSTCSLNNGSAQVNVTSALPPYSLLWTSGDTTSAINNQSAGWATVVITDSVGCTHPDSIYIVTIPTIGPAFSSQVNNICPGDNKGSVHVATTGGTTPFNFQWSNGDNGMSADSLSSGYISVQITDGSGCIETDSVLIAEPNTFAATYNVTNAFCAGVNNGAATITLSGGTSPYNFSWSNGDAGNSADSLSGGYAHVTYTDQNGCTGVDSVNIIQLTALTTSLASVTGVNCYGQHNGSATVNAVSGGAAPYDYQWSNGDNGFTADSLPQGNATVTITDANNCEVVVTASISEPSVLNINVTIVPITCGAVNDGQAIANVTGGTAGYIYSWDTAQHDSVYSGLSAGTYVITVTDANNCIDTAHAIIPEDDCHLELPSAFSPNADGFNDYYVVHGLSRYPENELTVFNRWGNEVFREENYKNTDWFGQNKTNEPLPDGTYFVTFTVRGEKISKNTYVDLRRGK